MASTALRISIAGQCASSYKEPIFASNSRSTITNSLRPLQPPRRPTVLCFSSRRRQRAIPSVSSKTFKEKVRKENVGEDEDAVDALFRKVEEVLKNGDDDISGEELEKLEQELAEALTDEELFGALESLARGETKNEEKEEEKEEEDDDEGEGEDDMSDEELAKLVQELAEVLEDDELFEEMESIVRGESKNDDDDDDGKLAKLKLVLEEKEEQLAKLEQELAETLAEEEKDDEEEELAKLEQELDEALEEEDDDDDDDDDYDEEEQEDDDEEEVEVVKVEVEVVEDDDDEEDDDDGNDISEEELVELVEELSEALKDGEMLINFSEIKLDRN